MLVKDLRAVYTLKIDLYHFPEPDTYKAIDNEAVIYSGDLKDAPPELMLLEIDYMYTHNDCLYVVVESK